MREHCSRLGSGPPFNAKAKCDINKFYCHCSDSHNYLCLDINVPNEIDIQIGICVWYCYKLLSLLLWYSHYYLWVAFTCIYKSSVSHKNVSVNLCSFCMGMQSLSSWLENNSWVVSFAFVFWHFNGNRCPPFAYISCVNKEKHNEKENRAKPGKATIAQCCRKSGYSNKPRDGTRWLFVMSCDFVCLDIVWSE